MALSDEELATLFEAPESESGVERKASINDVDKIRQAICAFANDLPQTRKPGVLFIGQHDDLSCAHLKIDDALLATIGGWRSDGKFQPFPTVSVERRTVRGCEIAVVVVQPSDNTPMRYDGRVWIRIGPRRAIASADEERRLTEKRRSRNLPFDAQGVPDAALDDLDLVRFEIEYLRSAVPPDVLAMNGRSDIDQMRALRLVTRDHHPTATAILILGKSTQNFFPGAYVQVLRIDGRELTDPIVDRHELTGTIPDQVRQMEELADLWNSIESDMDGSVRVDRASYPLVALRQLFRNAVIHRSYEGTNSPVRVTWYNDRVEIQNPGGLYGQVTPETLGRAGITDYRNPTIAEAMKALGFVERFGVGLQIVRSSLEKNGNPPAEFVTEAPNNFLALVRRGA